MHEVPDAARRRSVGSGRGRAIRGLLRDGRPNRPHGRPRGARLDRRHDNLAPRISFAKDPVGVTGLSFPVSCARIGGGRSPRPSLDALAGRGILAPPPSRRGVPFR